MSENERNFIRTICISCLEKETLINLPLEYQETKFMCDACCVKRDNLHEEVAKFLGDTGVFCPRKCGLRGKFHEIKKHEASCRKNVPRFLCLICLGIYLEDLSLYKAQDLITHIQEQHFYNMIVIENFTEYKFPVTVESNTSFLRFNNLDNIELYLLQVTEKDKSVYMIIKHMFSLKAGDHVDNMTFRRFSILRSKNSKSPVLNGNIAPANRNLHTDVETENTTEVTAFKKTNVFVSLLDTFAEELPDKFLSELECDICIQVLTIPIRLCNGGHSLCDACFKKVKKCPKCNAGLSKARNYALERVVSQIKTHCKNRDAGCKEKLNGEELQSHMNKCQFRSFNCTNCKKVILYKDLVSHAHCLAPSKLGTMYSLNSQSQPMRFFAFDELFILHVNPSKEDRIIPNDAMGNSNTRGYQECSCGCVACRTTTFCIENFTSLKNIQFYFDLTIFERIEGKSITFSAKCRKQDLVKIPIDYFKEGRDLKFCLNIYEKLEEE